MEYGVLYLWVCCTFSFVLGWFFALMYYLLELSKAYRKGYDAGIEDVLKRIENMITELKEEKK